MELEENQNQENTTEENPISTEPKQEVVGNVPVVEETPAPIKTPMEEQTETPPVEQVGVEQKIETPITEETNEEAGLPRSEELPPSPSFGGHGAETTVEENPQTQEIPQVEEVEQPQPVQQEQPQPQSEPQPQQTQTVEKIIYQTPPNLIQNLLTKARAKIQERKNKKLDKIMLLFKSNPNISNSDVQELLRTTKRSATRYLNILEKEQKIIQVGKAGRSVKYIKKP